MINAQSVKQLREETGVSIMECKKALEESNGNKNKALDILHKKGRDIVSKKSKRETKQGIIESYIHNNSKIGVLLELYCETDFVARNKEFKELAHDLTLHIASMAPKDIESLLKEPFVKNPEILIKELIDEKITKIGENIKIGRFIRYEL